MRDDTITAEDTRVGVDDAPDEFAALQRTIGALKPLDPEARRRIVEAASTFLQIDRHEAPVPVPRQPTEPYQRVHPPFSDDTSMSPKDFLLHKQPRTDVERIACLGYYLTHYREMPHFKTLDLSKVNTEAAQPKFANAANSVNNAVKRGYLVPSTKGQRQLSAVGEQFVRALPDRELAKGAMAAVRPRRKRRASHSTEAVGS